MRTLVRPAVFALLSIGPAIALLDPAIWHLCGSILVLASRRLGFPWWPIALVAALLVAHGLVDAQSPCVLDE